MLTNLMLQSVEGPWSGPVYRRVHNNPLRHEGVLINWYWVHFVVRDDTSTSFFDAAWISAHQTSPWPPGGVEDELMPQ